jgi:hypothetical protein
MLSCYFFLPVLSQQVDHRLLKLCRVLDDLMVSIKQASEIGRFTVHMHLNGPKPVTLDLNRLVLFLCRRFGIQITLTYHSLPDKIVAVNVGLSEARNQEYDLFFCVDNDIEIPKNTVPHMIELFRSEKVDGVVCEKAPLLTIRSTEFQVLFSSFVFSALTYQIFPNRRPTGSFYCIDPLRIYAFPLGCNEGDYLARNKIIHTNTFVYSEYPSSLVEEVERRKRIQRASISLGYVRDIQNLEYVEYIEKDLPFPHYVQTNEFWSSFHLYKNVIDLVSRD